MGFLKSIGGIICSLFGFDEFSKSKNGEILKNDINDICDSIGSGHIFQTQKDKEESEKRAKAKERLDIAQTNQNMKDIVSVLKEINRKL